MPSWPLEVAAAESESVEPGMQPWHESVIGLAGSLCFPCSTNKGLVLGSIDCVRGKRKATGCERCVSEGCGGGGRSRKMWLGDRLY